MATAVLAVALALTAGGEQTKMRDLPPPFPREMRGVWVATVSNIDWASSRTRTTTQQRTEANTILDKCVEIKANAVFLQMRPACDALYPSQIEPWSEYLTNVMGNAPNPLYDPLQYWIDEAKKRGLELHVWFNPYRARASSGTSAVSSGHVSITHPQLVRNYGNEKWLDPGEPLTPDYTRSVIRDVITRYDVDGVHFDDYFYPYPISGTPFPDDSSYAAYQAGGGTLGRSDWRRDNVNRLVQSLYQEIKELRPNVKFGISPFGIWRPGNPSGITGLDAYASLYADSRKWLQQGWVDYLAPQLYWTIASSGQSYPRLLEWWTQQNPKGRHVWAGNFTSNVGSSYGDWPVSEIINQITVTRGQAGATGNIHFSARALRGNWKGITDELKNGVYAKHALSPAYPWLDNRPPTAPRVGLLGSASTTYTFAWKHRREEPLHVWTAYRRYGRTWTSEILPISRSNWTVPSSSAEGPLTALAIAAVDRNGNESPLSLWTNDRYKGR